MGTSTTGIPPVLTEVPALSLPNLPDHILQLIHSFLEIQTLRQTTQVSKLFHEHALRNPTYTNEITIHQLQASQGGVTAAQKAKIHRVLKVLSICFLGKMEEWLCIMCALLYTILVTMKIDKTVDWSWEFIFTPLLPIFYHLIGIPLVVEIGSKYCGFNLHNLRMNTKEALRPLFFAELFFTYFKGKSLPKARFVVYYPILDIFIFFLLLLLRLTEPTRLSIWQVMFPLQAVSVYLMIVPFLQPRVSPKRFLISFIIAIFIFLITLKLENSPQSWTVTFIPAFALTGYYFVVAFVAIFCCGNIDDTPLEWLAWNGAGPLEGIVLLAFLGPLLAFEILLMLYLEHHKTSFALVTIPFFIIEALGICFCGIKTGFDCAGDALAADRLEDRGYAMHADSE